jgi:hypothetical protein
MTVIINHRARDEEIILPDSTSCEVSLDTNIIEVKTTDAEIYTYNNLHYYVRDNGKGESIDAPYVSRELQTEEVEVETTETSKESTQEE